MCEFCESAGVTGDCPVKKDKFYAHMEKMRDFYAEKMDGPKGSMAFPLWAAKWDAVGNLIEMRYFMAKVKDRTDKELKDMAELVRRT
jgi:hypothetical protein